MANDTFEDTGEIKRKMNYNLDFMTTQDVRSDKIVKEYIVRILDEFFIRYPQENVEAIVLAGGMSRGEASVRYDVSKEKFFIYSDFDSMIFLKEEADTLYARIHFPLWAREIAGALRRENLCSHIDFGIFKSDFFLNIGPTMFSTEFKKTGKVILGKPDFLDRMPDLRLEEIPAYETLELFFNRIMGQLIFLPDLKSRNQNEVEFAIYHTGKIYLDLAGAILILFRRYRVTYKEREEEFLKLFRDAQELGWLREKLPDMDKKIKIWTEFKLKPDFHLIFDEVPKDRDELERQGLSLWIEAVDYLKKVWLWANNFYFFKKVVPSELDIRRIAKNYFKRTSLKNNFLYWYFLWKHPHINRKDWSFWRALTLSSKGPPRLLVNLTGVALLFIAPAVLGFSQTEDKDLVERYLKFVHQHLPLFKGSPKAEIPERWEQYREAATYCWRLITKGGGE